MSESMKSNRLLKEFAIDPECFRTFDQFQRIIQNVGISLGRYIADLPRENWLASVRRILKTRFPDRGKEIEIELEQLQKANGLIATRSSTCLAWLDAALTEQQHRPFDALVTNNEQVPFRVLPECLSTRSGPWHVESGDRIHKNAQEIAKFASPLFYVSAEIKLVDAYFHPKKKRYTESLRALANEAATCRPSYDRFEYHCLIDHSYIKRANEQGRNLSDSDWIREFKEGCQQYLPHVIPLGFPLSIVVWDRNPSGETMHSRYIMSDITAIKIDYGLDESDVEVSTDIDLVSARVHRTRWDDLRLNSRTYRLAKSVDIIGTFR